MKISINWLRDFVDIPENLSGKRLAELLTLHTAEVEGIHDENARLENIVVGKIIKVKKHPNADKLVLTDTNIGEKIVQIVCGGKNVRESLTVAVALPGAWVNWHGAGPAIKLEKTAIRGEESFGMICAGEEIGLAHSLAGEIMELDSGFKPGTPLAKVLKKDDIILEIDNKSLTHRPDLWGHYGIAREFAAILGKKLKPYKTKASFPKKGAPLTITIKNPNIVPRFTACLIKNVNIEPSPKWIQQRLESVGIRPINNIVDVTNFVMLEYGQPMHAYDRKKVATDTLEARLAKNGETIET
ncbi:phenylalanine--tRNA ligase subunit beta, partial [Candidatus Peregrinibacteria bacterium]|nr:phenylalanine--tRNA ligase subunit beta [Candidatus Peregrinibacteria bacterium]